MIVIGQQIAKRRLGRPTFSRALKARASLQKLQNRFKGSEEWPGSPSSKPKGSDDCLADRRNEEKDVRVNRTLDFS